jgi:hypothetical protein
MKTNNVKPPRRLGRELVVLCLILIAVDVLGAVLSQRSEWTERQAFSTTAPKAMATKTLERAPITTLPFLPVLPVNQPAPGILGNDAFGISDGSLYTLSDDALDAEFEDIALIGVGRVRSDLPWDIVKGRGVDASPNWGPVDRVVAVAARYHLTLIFILNSPPRWAVSADCPSSIECPPDIGAFADFATAAVARYAPRGVHDWEIWNEPNLKSNWLPAADAQTYTALLKAAYAAIKSADPEAVVISGGLSPAATGSGTISPTDFLTGMYAAGARNYFDAVGDHPYSFPLSPSTIQPWNAWSQMDAMAVSLRSIMKDNDDSGKQIWITEYGAPTGGPSGVSEAIQAESMLEAIGLVRETSWAGPLFWYSYQDLGTDAGTSENFFGIRRYDGSAKPAYSILKGAAGG